MKQQLNCAENTNGDVPRGPPPTCSICSFGRRALAGRRGWVLDSMHLSSVFLVCQKRRAQISFKGLELQQGILPAKAEHQASEVDA